MMKRRTQTPPPAEMPGDAGMFGDRSPSWRPILKVIYAYLDAEPLTADERRRLKILAERIEETHRNNWDGYIPEAELNPEDWDV